MSAAKRRIKRKIAMLVQMIEMIERMQWQRQRNRRENLEVRQERLFSAASALGKALANKGYEDRAMAAIRISPRAMYILQVIA